MRILLLSSERSGSNLLRSIMGAHSQISAPIAPQILRPLHPLLHFYDPLAKINNLEMLIHDMIEMTKLLTSPWDIGLTAENVKEELKDPNFWTVWDSLYQRYAQHENKPHWFSKENDLFDYAFEALNALDNIKFIYLVRDGRDYACSMKKTNGQEFDYYIMAKKWVEEQNKCLRAEAQLKPQGNVIRVHYEDLIKTPEAQVQKICDYLKLTYEEEMLNYFTSKSVENASSSQSAWKNLSKPIMNNNYNKYKSSMSPKELALFENVAGPYLRHLGYETQSTTSTGSISYISKKYHGIYNSIQKRLHANKRSSEKNRVKREQTISDIRSRFMKRQ